VRAWRGGTGHWAANPRNSPLPTTSCPGAHTSSSLRIHQTYSGTGSSTYSSLRIHQTYSGIAAPTYSSLRIHQTYSGTGSSYLIIHQDTPDLLRYRKLLPTHPAGYTRPTQVQEAPTYSSRRIHQTYSGTGSFYLLIAQDTPGLLRYSSSYLLIPQDTPDLLRYSRSYLLIPQDNKPTQVQELLPTHPARYTRPTQVQETPTYS
jgi:hypothetical protein